MEYRQIIEPFLRNLLSLLAAKNNLSHSALVVGCSTFVTRIDDTQMAKVLAIRS